MEIQNIPIIGNPSDRTVLAMNKHMAKGMMLQYDIPCPPGQVIRRDTIFNLNEIEYPCVVKPSHGGDSKGMSLVKSPSDLDLALEKAFAHSPDVLIEKFIAGREVRCSCIEVIDQTGKSELIAMPPREYHVPQETVRSVDYKLALDENGLPVTKAAINKSSFICKEKEPTLYKKLQRLMVKVHRMLRLKDFSVIDIRVDSDGNPWVLEVNLFCSFGAQSLLSDDVKEYGWSLEKLFQTMVKNNIMERKADI